VFVHLLGQEFNRAQNNFLWGQVDSIPVNGALPTTAWSIDEVIRDAYALPILPNAPAETYRIEIGLYDAATGVRLKMADGTDALVLDSLIVR
jgi:hypothetical protein